MKKTFNKKLILGWLKALGLAYLIALIIRSVLFETATIQDDAMTGSLEKGDVVLIEKLPTGTRTPISLFSIPFIKNVYLDWVRLPYGRIFSTGSINKYDIIAFNYSSKDLPIDKMPVYIRRCIGLPGDTIEIINKTVFINGKAEPTNQKVVKKFRVVTKGMNFLEELIEKYQISKIERYADIGIFDLLIPENIADSLKKCGLISSIVPLTYPPGYKDKSVFPDSDETKWNTDHLGPYIIPAKGMNIKIDTGNYYLYKDLISINEYENISFTDTSYQFKNDYYFLLGDNRDQCLDSRHFGPVCEDRVTGKIKRILFSSSRKIYFKSIE